MYELKAKINDYELAIKVDKRSHARIIKENLENAGIGVEVLQTKPVVFKEKIIKKG